MEGFGEYVNSRPARLAEEQTKLDELKTKMNDDGHNALLNKKIKFGKHKDKEYFMIPESYIQWMQSKDMLQPNMVEAFKLYKQKSDLERSISHLMRDPYD
jgi:uncharacterized protein (DUF3820 family)